MSDVPESTPSRLRLRAVHLLIWMLATAMLFGFRQALVMPDTSGDRSPLVVFYIFAYAAVGGVATAFLFSHLPRLWRQDGEPLETGELLCVALGTLILGDLIVEIWCSNQSSAGLAMNQWTYDDFRRYIILHGLLALAVFLSTACLARTPWWRSALLLLACSYLLWMIPSYLRSDAEYVYGRYYRNARYENPALDLGQVAAPMIVGGVMLMAALLDRNHQVKNPVHWIGIALLVLVVAKTMHFVGWHQTLMHVLE